MRIARVDQIDFPLPVPVLELLLTGYGIDHVAEDFEMDEPVDFVPPGEPWQDIAPMLPQATDEIGSDADIQRAIVSARKNIDTRDAFLPHGPECAARWTLKQVQGDEEGMDLESSPNLCLVRHAELVSASIARSARIKKWSALDHGALKRAAG
jgi:hypothetical protein